ncbi:tRNA (adenine(58)-N(1))-methyltransferase non-catalytic subunit TRM6 isoform X2 [Perognathus longimembris pacificus]|uniref:tRNA (adenine(58)-N(1))-methyltransferase non-catalytic subunit TRM6 isoform X2 n=1 Tax=Perognathus longimembris pacificus TaxID=214514 RepID=UPI0020186242|nr:tRNA (adenine(58)-N(1))-methyltransferase non-catalytic subunit TRM6 isoform X2 [Perognathus longimembris pacificus]
MNVMEGSGEQTIPQPPHSGDHCIHDGDFVVLKREDVFKAVQVQRRKKVTFEKQWFYLDNVIGHSYGSTFEVTSGGSLQPKKKKEEPTSDTKEAGTDNRNIIDDGKSQKLTQDDIKALKDQGIKGEEIVQQLIENSTTFRDKTEFAQDKYIKKKKKKYEAIITILKPSTRILSIMYYAREPGKINHMRYDTLAQMLTLGNIRAGNKMIVMETCSGLVLGAIMERMGGFGSIIQLYPGDGPVRVATACFGFPKSFFSGLYEFPLNKVDSLLNGTFSAEMLSSEPKDSASLEESNGAVEEKQSSEQDNGDNMAEAPESNLPEEQEVMEIVSQDTQHKEPKEREGKKDYEKQRRQEEQRKRHLEAAALLRERNADGLIVASRFHPTPLLLSLLDFVAPSRPFVVYCQYKEPLLECYTKLRERGGVINLRLSETWLRNYQVLPDRSHPKLLMSGGGGYLLSGFTVVLDNLRADASLKSSTSTLESPQTEEPAPKKQKCTESGS